MKHKLFRQIISMDCCHVSAGTLDYYFDMLEKIKKQVYCATGPTFAYFLALQKIIVMRSVFGLRFVCGLCVKRGVTQCRLWHSYKLVQLFLCCCHICYSFSKFSSFFLDCSFQSFPNGGNGWMEKGRIVNLAEGGRISCRVVGT